MILPDVNTLVYAFRAESEDHPRYADWLARLVAGSDGLGLTEASLTGFLRIVTNPRVFADPAPTGDALTFLGALRAAPRAHWLTPSPAVWATLGRFAATDRAVRGNHVPDAWLASLCVAHGCRLATADRGFARYDGLDWFDPVHP